MKFEFKYNEGKSHRIVSEVSEDVYFNGEFSHHAEISNHAFITVDRANPDGSADFSATYTTTDRAEMRDGEFANWGEEYKSSFNVDKLGHYKISDEFYMPSVRDVPVFPDDDIDENTVWQADGSEAHDVGRAFNLGKPVIVPSHAIYKYEGELKDENGDVFHLITVDYEVKGKTNVRTGANDEEVPAFFSGKSRQNLYWNAKKGRVEFYDEKFEIAMQTTRDNVFVFTGTARAQVYDDTLDEKLDEIQEKIEELDIDNVEVEKTEKGIKLSIENIQFVNNSDEFLPGEDEKLEKISEILKEFSNHDLLISGHTALAGTPKSRAELSLKRAQAVANFLQHRGSHKKSQMFVEGLGAERPIADNSTPEGMAKNRRVEITIMP